MKKKFYPSLLALFVIICLTRTNDAFSQLTDWQNYTNSNWANQILSDGDYLWLASDGGLIKINKATKEKSFYNRANAGLPDNHILSLAKDKEGNIWIGSRYSGVGCFDGEKCKVYKTSNSAMKRDQYCTSIVIGEDNTKWIGSLLYLNKFDGKSWQSWTTPGSELISSIWAIHTMKFDKDSILWMGGPSTGYWSFAKFDGKEINILLDVGQVRGIEIDKSDNKWLATDYGLIKYDNKGFTLFNHENSSLPYNNLMDVQMDKEGNLWIVGGEYLIKYDGVDFLSYKVPFIYPANWLTCLEIEGEDIWIGTKREGIYLFKNGEFERIDCNNSPLRSNDVSFCADIDKDNNVWIGTAENMLIYDGQDKWNLFLEKIEFNNTVRRVLGVNCAPNGDMWVSLGRSDTCMLKINLNDTLAFTFDSNPLFKELAEYSNSNYVFDRKGNVWMASRTGLFKYDGTNWSCYTPENSPLPDYQITALAVDKEDNLWVGSGSPYGGGLCKYDGNAWTIYTKKNADLPTYVIGSIGIDSKNVLWLSCRDTTFAALIGRKAGGGLTRFDGKTWTTYNIKNSKIPSNTIMDIVIDKNDHLWLATYGGVGLTKFDGTNWEIYNVNNSGIACDDVSKITLDYKRDLIWLNHLKFGGISTAKLNFDGNNIEMKGFDNNTLPLIYPNPAKDHIAFRLKENETPEKAEVYDMSGRLICSKPIHSSSVALSELNIHQKGIYLLKIFTTAEKNYSDRLIVIE